MKQTKVAILGLGTVGCGVARLLLQQSDRIALHAGQTLVLSKALVRDKAKSRDIDLPTDVLCTQLAEITNDPDITTVAELVGGVEPARSMILKLLESGKNIVTANKALLAEHGPELFKRAQELGLSISFEAAVAGGIPIVTNLGQCLSANQVTSLLAILNGTSNYILSQMESQGVSYEQALCEAQRLGYAEADPTMDVDGTDTVQKLAILSQLAFGAQVFWKEIPCQGIDGISAAEINYAKELGYRIKLLAVAQLANNQLELHVSPTLVRIGTPLAEVYEAYNAVNVEGDAVGNVFYHGQGAGQMPTASAVVADLIDSATGRAAITFERLELWSCRDNAVTPCDHTAVKSRYYLRFNVDDSPRVLAQIAGILGNHEISIASVIQHEGPESEHRIVPLVIMTHRTTEGAAEKAIEEINLLPCLQGAGVCMRVLDESGS